MNPRDAYIAYQSEIGTEEVVLPRPWSRKVAVAPQAVSGPVPGKIAREKIPAGPGFFQAIAQALKEPAVGARHAVPPLPAPLPVKPSDPAIPEFPDLDAYWKFLEREYPRWFPGHGAIARAEGMAHAALAVVELSPSSSTSPMVFSGENGVLLERMMKAIHLDRSRLYLTAVMKTPPTGRSWARKDLARMLPWLMRELKLAACPMALLLGEDCAQAVLRTGSGLEVLRGRPFESEGLVFAASHHPAQLEGNQELKRKSWDDLKWLRMRLDAAGT